MTVKCNADDCGLIEYAPEHAKQNAAGKYHFPRIHNSQEIVEESYPYYTDFLSKRKCNLSNLAPLPALLAENGARAGPDRRSGECNNLNAIIALHISQIV